MNSDTRLNKAGEFVANFEGCVIEVNPSTKLCSKLAYTFNSTYKCPVYDDGFGNATRGFGTCYDVYGNKITFNTIAVSQATAFSELLSIIDGYMKQCFTEQQLATMSDNQYCAFASLIYNVGVNAFNKSTVKKQYWGTTYIGTFSCNDSYNQKINSMAYNWASEVAGFNKVNGEYNQALSTRRVAELNMFFNGVGKLFNQA